MRSEIETVKSETTAKTIFMDFSVYRQLMFHLLVFWFVALRVNSKYAPAYRSQHVIAEMRIPISHVTLTAVK